MSGAAKIQILPLRKAGDESSSHRRVKTPPHASAAPTPHASAPRPNIKQKGLKKVRTGCVTCKIRRVKCDETKPECNKCTSTGRKCDGYDIPPRKKRSKPATTATANANVSAPPAIEPCLELVRGSQDELLALEFFQQRTAPALASYFDLDFWQRLVQQISHSEPAIRHALIAVASLHRQREGSTNRRLDSPSADVRSNTQIMFTMDSPLLQAQAAAPHPTTPTAEVMSGPSPGHNDPFGLAQYNKAISLLTSRLSQADSSSVDITLLACILFVCVEFIRGDAEYAIKHFRGGMQIAMDTISKNKRSRVLAERMKTNYLPFFNRLEILAMLFGNDSNWDYPTSLETALPEHFSSIRDMRNSLVHIMNLSLRFIRSTNRLRYLDGITNVEYARAASLTSALFSWESKLDTFLVTRSVDPRDLVAARILRVHQIIARIWVASSIRVSECYTDLHNHDFEAAVQVAESLPWTKLSPATSASSSPESSSSTHSSPKNPSPDPHDSTTFLFDMEIVSPLYFIAIKCRHRSTRRRAIAILRKMSRREGLWDSNMAAAVAERVMQIEESSIPPDSDIKFPPEEARVHDVHIDSSKGIDPTEHHVTFHLKRKGDDGEERGDGGWESWEETIFVDGFLSNCVGGESCGTGPPPVNTGVIKTEYPITGKRKGAWKQVEDIEKELQKGGIGDAFHSVSSGEREEVRPFFMCHRKG